MVGTLECSAVEMKEARKIAWGHTKKYLNVLSFTLDNTGTWKGFRKVIQLVEWKMGGNRREQAKKWERKTVMTVFVPEE